MNAVADRLNLLIKRLNVTDSEFAAVGAVSKSALSGYLNGKSYPKHNALTLWTSAYKVNANWLLHGVGEPFLTESLKDKIKRKTDLIHSVKPQSRAVLKSQSVMTVLNDLQNNLMQIEQVALEYLEEDLLQVANEDDEKVSTGTSSGYYLASKDYNGFAFFHLESGKVTLRAGSRLIKKAKPSQHKKTKDVLLSVLSSCKAIELDDEYYMLTQDVEGLSPSTAANLVTGYSTNGLLFWHELQFGNPLKDTLRSRA